MEEHSPHYLQKLSDVLIFKHFLPRVNYRQKFQTLLWNIAEVNLHQRYTNYTETTYAKMIDLLQPQGLEDIPPLRISSSVSTSIRLVTETKSFAAN